MPMTDPRIQQALQYWQQVQSGQIANPTMQTRRFAQDMANELGGIMGSAYDDSWLKGYLGYGNPNAGLDLQRMQMQYANQRAQNTGAFDQSWMPAMPNAGTGVAPIQQRQFAVDWANTMGKHGMPVNEVAIQQFLGGNTPQSRALQEQYVWGLLDRTGQWRPDLVQAPLAGGTPTADQYLDNLRWQMAKDYMQGQVYNPETGQYQMTAPVAAEIARRFLPTTAEGLGGLLDPSRFVGAVADRVLSEAGSPNQRFAQEVSDAVQQSVAGLSERDKALVEQFKKTAAVMGYNEFLQYIEERRDAVGDKVADVVKDWALANRYNWYQVAQQY